MQFAWLVLQSGIRNIAMVLIHFLGVYRQTVN